MPEKNVLYAVLCFNEADFNCVKLYSTIDKALAEAARFINAHFNADFINEMTLDGNFDEMREWMENMQSLFKQEAYKSFVECWDEWITEGNYNIPAICNFDIEELTVDAV